MAIEVGQAYVTILPSMQGIQKKITAELKPALEGAGKEAGKAVEDGLAKGAQNGSKSAGKTIESEIPKSGKKAGDDTGKKISEGLKNSTTKASDEVAKSVESKLSGAFAKVSDSLKNVGSMAKSSFGMLGSQAGQMFGNFGAAIKGSAVGTFFGGIASSAKTAVTNVVGTFKGVGSAIGGALSNAASKAGGAFASIRDRASAVFGAMKSAAQEVGIDFEGIFSTIGGVASKALGGLGKLASVAFKGLAAGVAAVSGAAIAFGKNALDAYGNFEQLEGGIKLTLGDDVWATVEERSKRAFADMQISQNDYLEKVNLLSTGLKESLGGDAEAAAKLADDVIRAQADIVSAKGIDPQTVSDVFSAVSRGTYQTLDSLGLGIKGTKEGMQEVIDKANEWRIAQGETGDLTIESMADCQQALVDYVSYLDMAGYAQREGADTIQGSLSKMSAAWTDWMAELAKPDADMEAVTQNLVESVGDVAGNVIPVLARATGTAFKELPSLVMTVGPELGTALIGIVDEATGGLGTAAMEKLEPLTSAIGSAFEGAMGWFTANQPMLETIGGQFADIGGQMISALGGAIEFVTPILGNLASAALPLVSSALTFLSGAFSAVVSFISTFISAISPVIDAVAPVAEAIGGALCDALSTLGDWLGKLDFGAFAEAVSGAIKGVIDTVQGAIDSILGFFDGVASFLADPVGTIENGLDGIRQSFGVTAENAEANMGSVEDSVSRSMKNSSNAIKDYNGVSMKSKNADAKVKGNAIDGGARTQIGNTQSKINSLSGKSVEVKATGNVIDGGAQRTVSNTIDAISRLTGKTVDVITNNITRNRTEHSAAGHIFKMAAHADGAIVTRPLYTNIGLVGEAGVEAIVGNGQYTGVFPLSNKRYTGPFANEISSQVLAGMGSATRQLPSVNVYVDGSTDPEQVAWEVADRLQTLLAAS